MKCLCCGKEIDVISSSNWHKDCIYKFFSKTELPNLILDKEAIDELINNNVLNKSLVPGVQKKLSLGLSSKSKRGRLTLVDYPSGYILKPQVKKYPYLPELEHLTMLMANTCKIKTVPHALIKVGDDYAYITKRIDRDIKDGQVKCFAMEDFCQLDNKLTYQKYNGSYEQCCKIIEKYSSQCGLDLVKFFYRLVFNFIVGNSDMHFKNFSLIANTNDRSIYQLSPAYDLVPTNLIIPGDEEEFALTIRAKKRNVTRNDFIKFGQEHCHLNKNAVIKYISSLISYKEELLRLIDESMISDELKIGFKKLINERITRLSEK